MTATLFAIVLSLSLQVDQGSLDDLVQILLQRLEGTRLAGLHRFYAGPGGTGVAPPLPEGVEGGYYVLRRVETRGRAEYLRLSTLRGRRLEQLAAGGAAAGLQTGDLLRRVGWMPGVAVRVAPAGISPPHFAHLLERTLAANLAATGLYKNRDFTPELASDELFIDADLPRLREALRRLRIDALLNVVIYIGARRMSLFCQLVSAEGSYDELLSVSAPLTPELALLLQNEGSTPRAEPVRLILSVPLPAGVLDITAADLDGSEGDELAVLTQGALLVYAFSGDELTLSRNISLATLPPALYPTRTPSGKVVAGDLDRDGSAELLIGSNLWAGGAIIDLYPRVEIRPLDVQPLALTLDGDEPAIIGGLYRPGEDCLEDRLVILNKEGASYRYISLPGVRSLHRLDPAGELFVIVAPDGKASMWYSPAAGVPVRLEIGTVKALATSPRLAAGWTLHAGRAVGNADGDRVYATKILYPRLQSAAILSGIDVIAIAAYNPPGPQPRAVALCGRDGDGVTRLFLYGWPAVSGW